MVTKNIWSRVIPSHACRVSIYLGNVAMTTYTNTACPNPAICWPFYIFFSFQKDNNTHDESTLVHCQLIITVFFLIFSYFFFFLVFLSFSLPNFGRINKQMQLFGLLPALLIHIPSEREMPTTNPSTFP